MSACFGKKGRWRFLDFADPTGTGNEKDGDKVVEGLPLADSFPFWQLEQVILAMVITPSVTERVVKSTASIEVGD